MKTSLSHLPKNKQYEIVRISDIIKEVLNPEMVILFGSYAKGTYVEHKYQTQDRTIYEYISDYDFLVVMKNIPEKLWEYENTIMDRVDRFDPPVNLEIHDIEYINYGLERGQYFFNDIVKEGITLYNTAALSFKDQRELTTPEQKEQAKEYFERWFGRSKSFLETSDVASKLASNSEDQLKVSVFNLHQATESLYYALLLVFTGYKPKIHSLWKLRRKTKAYSKDLFEVFRCETDTTERDLFDLLHRGYVDARYKRDYVITAPELTELISRVRTMQSMVETICIAKIESL